MAWFTDLWPYESNAHEGAVAMTHKFCPGYRGTFQTLAEDYPSATAYPNTAFRIEWGPIFHRGRLDGTAKLLLIGQDPAAHEAVVRRVLVGEAGQRVQGFLWKLGIDTSYLFINTFLYSVYGDTASALVNDPNIAKYREAWLDEVTSSGNVSAIVSLGSLAHQAYQHWRAGTGAAAPAHAYANIMHPTADAHPSVSTAALLSNWNTKGLAKLTGVIVPDTVRPLVNYGTDFTTG